MKHLPEYYTNYIDSKIGQINFIEKEKNIDYSFFFVTDLHWEVYTKNSWKLIKYLTGRSSIKDVVLGGDYSSVDFDSAEEVLETMKSYVNSFDIENFVALLGNHETNKTFGGGISSITYEDAVYIISKEQSLFILAKRMKEIKFV